MWFLERGITKFSRIFINIYMGLNGEYVQKHIKHSRNEENNRNTR